MKKVPTASVDYLVSKIITLTIMSNIFIRNGIYPFKFPCSLIGWLFYGMSTLFMSFNAKLNFKEFSLV